MNKVVDLIDTNTGELHTGILLKGNKMLAGKWAVANGVPVNGFVERVEKEEPDEDLSIDMVDRYDDVSDEIMYTKPAVIRGMRERSGLLELCERLNIAKLIDTNRGNEDIISQVMKVRSIVKAKRRVK